MQRLKLLFYWGGRAWPFLAVTVIATAHYVAYKVLPGQLTMVNKVMSTAMQIVGGLIVLHVVNGNLGLFRKHSLISVFLLWIKGFPLCRRQQGVQLSGVASSTTFGNAVLSSKRPATSVDEKLAELERKVEEVRSLATHMVDVVHKRVDDLKTELSGAISTNHEDVRRLSERVERATVGGFKQQIFGVLLVIYGSIVSAYA